MGTDAVLRRNSGTDPDYEYRTCTRLVPYTRGNEVKRTRIDCRTKRDWSNVPKQYHCGSRVVPWQDYFGTDTVLEFFLGIVQVHASRSKRVSAFTLVHASRLHDYFKHYLEMTIWPLSTAKPSTKVRKPCMSIVENTQWARS